MKPGLSDIDYLKVSGEIIGRRGMAYNICSGCLHTIKECACSDACWAKECIKTRLRDHPEYPYGTEPTFRPDMVGTIGPKSKWLVALNFMGDVGGKWDWKMPGLHASIDSKHIAHSMVHFALLNPQHVILLLTKNPAWYGLVEWPDNCWLGFTATTNEEFGEPWVQIKTSFDTHTMLGACRARHWVSFEPWLDPEPPDSAAAEYIDWFVIGGLSKGRHGPARPVSEAVLDWLMDDSVRAKRFTKRNADPEYPEYYTGGRYPREYPDSWKVPLKESTDD